MYPNLGRQQVATAMKAVKSDEIVYEDFAIVVEEWQKINFERHGEEQRKRRSILGRLGWGLGSKSKKAWQRARALAKTNKEARLFKPSEFEASLMTLQNAGAPKEKVADVAAADVAAVFAAALNKADSMSA
jgi:hypothetical protein